MFVYGKTLSFYGKIKRRKPSIFSKLYLQKISRILQDYVQWDEIDPKQVLETLQSHQKSIREARLTIQKRRDETVSDLIYLPVVVNIMLIFINFIYIGYFIDQREMLTVLL